MLAVLDGSCRTPIAGLAQRDAAGGIILRGMVLRPDGSEAIEAVRIGGADEAAALGGDLGAELKARAGADYFTAG